MTSLNRLPPEARSVLDQLKSRIRSYVFWEGLALVVAVLGLLFWTTFAFDWAYFQLSHLELPRWFRTAVLLSGIALIAMGVFSWIGLRLFRGFRTKALAMVLERRFPELDDRLVTAVEAAEGLAETDSPVTAAMLQKTLTDVAKVTRSLDLGSVFDSQPLRRASMVAVAFVVSILGLWVVDSAAMDRWIAGYVRLQDGYWARETELTVKVVVQPGDQLREFVDNRYRHPKGADLVLSIEVPPGKKRPERIRLDSRMGRGLTQIWLTASSDNVFRHTFAGLIEDARLWVSGGDFSHPDPYVVEVVSPPEVTKVTLHCLYPEYTGLNQRGANGAERTPNELKGSQISLPIQTDFVMEIAANKPLRQARIEGDAGSDRWQIALTAGSPPMIVLMSNDGKPQLNLPFPQADGDMAIKGQSSFSLAFALDPDGATKLPELLRAWNDSGMPVTLPLPLPPDGLLRVTLEDIDQIVSPTPTRFTINGIVDQPPIVETKLKGIGTSITRKARIPVSGTIIDDYGVASVTFEYKVDDATEWQKRSLAVPPENEPREFSLQRSENEAYERFDVLPLDLSIKQRLTLTVAAFDSCTVLSSSLQGSPASGGDGKTSSPADTFHRSQGLKFAFVIIPEEELLSMLYGRELNLRKRVEQIISESKTTLSELQNQHDKLIKPTSSTQGVGDGGSTNGQLADGRNESVKANPPGLNAAADRSLHGIRKNAIETAGVESAFAEIREELINNAADTPAMLERLDVKILAPLNIVNTKNFPNIDGALGLFRLALEKETDPIGPLETSIDETTALIERLEAILGEMAEMARFDAVLEDLKKTIKAEMDLLEETKRKRKEKAIKALE
jgi:hypothetical protein